MIFLPALVFPGEYSTGVSIFWRNSAGFVAFDELLVMFWSLPALFLLVPVGSVPFRPINVYFGRFRRFSASFAMFSTDSAWFSAGLVIFRPI